jgi:hypothetical protein
MTARLDHKISSWTKRWSLLFSWCKKADTSWNPACGNKMHPSCGEKPSEGVCSGRGHGNYPGNHYSSCWIGMWLPTCQTQAVFGSIRVPTHLINDWMESRYANIMLWRCSILVWYNLVYSQALCVAHGKIMLGYHYWVTKFVSTTPAIVMSWLDLINCDIAPSAEIVWAPYIHYKKGEISRAWLILTLVLSKGRSLKVVWPQPKFQSPLVLWTAILCRVISKINIPTGRFFWAPRYKN